MSVKPHAFVAMPFGTKPGADGKFVDFNRVYSEFIEPALTAAGMQAFRADEERRAGDIRADMFQELLVADLVVADITIDNPNVWYELGVRHALRSRGVVLISGGSATKAFDVYTDRKLRYHLKEGGLDPARLEADIQALTEMVCATMESWHGRKISPVYDLLPNLEEPDWKSLRVGRVTEFWEKHDAWANRIELARSKGRIGDLLVLADEAPISALRAEGWVEAGIALRRTEQFAFALERLERGLEIEPRNLVALREQGICLQRLGSAGEAGHSLERARQHYLSVLKMYPKDAETWALLGRVNKDAWVASWRLPDRTTEQMRGDGAYEDSLLEEAIKSYAAGFSANPSNYYSGINALTLMHVYRDLTGDPCFEAESVSIEGAVRFAASHESDAGQAFWSKTTLGDLETLVGTPAVIRKAYKEAITHSANDWFALNSARAQLQLLRDLGFRPAAVDAAIDTFDRAMGRLGKPADGWKPRKVLLFSGHMVDAPNRPVPRFPFEKVAVAAEAIGSALEVLDAGAEDLALSQAAAGGDLLFLEACLKRGVRCRVLLPFEEPEFIQRSVLPSEGGSGWCERFYSVKAKLQETPRFMPTELGPLPSGVNPFERCNLWLLYTALSTGVEKVKFVTLWNGSGGDGPGGTEHMYNEIRRRTGQVTWLDTRQLWEASR